MKIIKPVVRNEYSCQNCSALLESFRGVDIKIYENFSPCCSEDCKFNTSWKAINASSDFFLDKQKKTFHIRIKPYYKELKYLPKKQRADYIRSRLVFEIAKRAYFIRSQRETPLSFFSFSQIMRRKMRTFSFSHFSHFFRSENEKKVDNNFTKEGLDKWL